MLATRRIAGPEVSRWVLVLHGVFGRGRNWASVASSLVAARPDVGVILADLRLHGASRGFAPPHDLAGATADVSALLAENPAVAVLGHSFGGKVALNLAARAPAGVRQVWIVDASPSAGAPEGNIWKLTRRLRAMPSVFSVRDAAVRALVEGGLDEPTARFVATNLVPAEGGGYRFAFDLDGIESLLRDYFATDLWPAIKARAAEIEIILVKAIDSVAISESDEQQFAAAAAKDPGLRLVRMKGGHWLHAEDPTGVVRLLADGLPRE